MSQGKSSSRTFWSYWPLLLTMQTFRLGQRCVCQLRGSPMGSPLSPALCLMMVSVNEQIWSTNFKEILTNHNPFIRHIPVCGQPPDLWWSTPVWSSTILLDEGLYGNWFPVGVGLKYGKKLAKWFKCIRARARWWCICCCDGSMAKVTGHDARTKAPYISYQYWCCVSWRLKATWQLCAKQKNSRSWLFSILARVYVWELRICEEMLLSSSRSKPARQYNWINCSSPWWTRFKGKAPLMTMWHRELKPLSKTLGGDAEKGDKTWDTLVGPH